LPRRYIAKLLLTMFSQCLDINFERKFFENSEKPIFLRLIKNEAENKKLSCQKLE